MKETTCYILMKRILSFFIFIPAVWSLQAQTLTATGGQKQAVTYSKTDPSSGVNRVFLFYGLENAKLVYNTSSSNTIKWFSYKNDINSKTPLNAGQSSITSELTGLENNTGYGVIDGNDTTIVWVIDYKRYEPQAINVAQENSDPCSQLVLAITANEYKMSYYDAKRRLLSHDINLEIPLQYNSMIYSPSDKKFIDKVQTKTLNNVQALVNLVGSTDNEKEILPLKNTSFTLEVPALLEGWGLNKVTSPTYEAVKVAVEGDHTHDPLHNEDNNTGGNETSESLTGTAPFSVVFNAYANQPTATYYSWTITNTTDGSRITTSTDDNIRYTFDKSGNYSVRVIVTNAENSCVDSLKYDVIVSESELKVPNAFSPGLSPGENDEFKVAFKSIVRFHGWIFNRWGVQLFQWTDPAKGWDGKVNGKYVTPGAYFYVIEAEGSDGVKYKKKGDVNVFSGK